MNEIDRREADNEPLTELEAMLTSDQRRGYDADHIAPPPLVDYPPARRSKVDADRLLSILDELAGGGE